MDYSYNYGYGGSRAGDAVAAMFAGCWSFVSFLIVVLIFVAMWKVFTKAGKPGWAAIVPIYNVIVLLEIVGRPLWWIVLYLIPFVNFVVSIIVSIDVAKAFGKDPAFGIGLAFLPPIFYPILGFGSARYVGPVAATTSTYTYPPQPPTTGAYYPPQPPTPPAPPAPSAYQPPVPPAPPAPGEPPEPPSIPPAPPMPPAPPVPTEPPEPPAPPAPPTPSAE